MSEMIILKCDVGSKAATIVCPNCGRISRQILKTAYTMGGNSEFISPHTCPVCGTVYYTCNSAGFEQWSSLYRRYTVNPEMYNSAAKESYLNRKNKPESTMPSPAKGEVPRQQQTKQIMQQSETIITAPISEPEHSTPQINNAAKGESYGKISDYAKPDHETRGEAVLDQEPSLGYFAAAAEPETTSVEDSTIISAQSYEPVYRAPEPAIAPEPAPMNISPLDSSYLPAFDRKLDRWKKELLDTSKRNKMISYRDTKRQTLNILEPSPSELFNMLAVGEKELTFQRPISKDSDFRTYSVLALLETLNYNLPVHVGDIRAEGTVVEREKTLKNLRSKTKLAQEEQGTNILYLSFGFILWREHDRDSSAWIKSPLLMMPVQLGLKSLNAPYTLSRHDDEIEVNPTLDYLFNQDYGIDLPTFEYKNRSSFNEYLENIEEIIDKRGWKLVREVSLGLLSFLKISMYHDLNNHRDLMLQSPVLQAIAGNTNAVSLPKEYMQSVRFDDYEPTYWHEVVDSDSSQEEAILLSKQGVSFVMQGPPGTGKSQTITNIIAEALADGKKILFVSEKSAALQIVLKRLTEVHLDDFCLPLHNYKANKKEIIDNIGKNLSLESEFIDNTAMNELMELFHDRKYLDEYADELHHRIDPLSESVYAIYGKLLSLQDSTHVDFAIDNPSEVSKERFAALLYCVDEFAKMLRNMDGRISENPWAGTSAKSAGQAFKTEMISACGSLSDSLNRLATAIIELNGSYGINIELTWNGSKQGLLDIDEALSLPLFPYDWCNAERNAALKTVALREERERNEEHTHLAKLNTTLQSLSSSWISEGLVIKSEDLKRIFENQEKWVGAGKPASMEACADMRVKSLEAMILPLETILKKYAEAVSLLHISPRDKVADVVIASRVLKILGQAPDMSPIWFDIRRQQELTSILAEAKAHQQSIRYRTDFILSEWEPGILSIDSSGMLARFKTEYTGVFSKMKSEYKADIKQIKLLSKAVGKQIDNNTVINLLQNLEGINSEKQWFDHNANRMNAAFPGQYQGWTTDFEKIERGIQCAQAIANQFPYGSISGEVISAIQAITGSPQIAATARKLADELREEVVVGCMNNIQNESYISGLSYDLMISSQIIPQIKKQLESEKLFLLCIQHLNKAKKDGSCTYADIASLLDATDKMREELKWFVLFDALDISIDTLNLMQELSLASQLISRHSSAYKQNRAEELAEMFGTRYSGAATDWQNIIRELDAVSNYMSSDSVSMLDGFIKTISNDMNSRDAVSDKILEVKRLLDACEMGVVYFDNLFLEEPLTERPLRMVADKYDACLNGFTELSKWLDLNEAKKECDEKGLSGFTNRIMESDNTIDDVKDAFQRGFYAQWLSSVIDQVPAVQSFRRRMHEQRLERFIKLDEKQFSLSINRIRDQVIRTFPDMNAVAGAGSERTILVREMNKKRRIMALRTLFQKIPNLLLTLKPCLMMSPLSVAHFLNADDYHFDMVIFDEASQIFPQDAIGAIFRADQVIIAGDTKQLPPTNFFSTSTSNTESEFDDDEEIDEEIYDSILEETTNVLPNRTLKWHYRSQHEHLIAFSNQEIYRGDLVTFPGCNEKEPDSGVEFVYVEDGYYERGTRRCNKKEAVKCAQLVKEHIDKHPERSLGVIAFGESQQQAILTEIQRFRESNHGYEEFFAEGKEDEFFVKNLENVQGDERDTIIISIGYAKTKEQIEQNKRMTLQFGPLQRAGGERRLNVAITRAKRNIKVVSSIKPSDIDLSRTESEGIRLLHDYIEFAMTGAESLVSTRGSNTPDGFVDGICDYLSSKGYHARRYVGCSDYKIDIAIAHPHYPNELVAGIECDGIAYSRAKTARDRDRLRKTVLERMGWNLYRVWSTEWLMNQEVEAQKLIDFVDGAIKGSTERLQKIEEEMKLKETEELRKRLEEEQERQRKAREEEQKQLEAERIAREKQEERERLKEEKRRAAEEKKRLAAEQKRQRASDLENKRSVRRQELKNTGEQMSIFDVPVNGDNSQTGDSSGNVYDELLNNGFYCVDNRTSSDIIWVLYQPEHSAEFETIMKNYHLKYRLERRGALATDGRAAWRIMCQ